MATRAKGADLLVDTSVAISLVVEDHTHHRATMDAIGARRLGLAGHAAFETFSVLSRLPGPARRTPAAIERVLRSNFPATRYLGAAATEALFGRLGELAVAGGSVHDALVASAAAEHGLTLDTRDRRALPTYRALEIDIELLS